MPPEYEPHPPISVITWVNDLPLYEGLIKKLLYYVGLKAYGPPNVEFIPILPGDGARNIGEAYNMGRARASHTIKAYLHQDLAIVDTLWDRKMGAMLRRPQVGGLGFIGCRGVLGPQALWSPPEYWAGVRDNPHRYYPECQPVWWVDAMGFVTNQDFAFAECYEAQHFPVEDYCMQVKQAGLSVWTVDVKIKHLPAGSLVGEDFWRSAALFRERWKHFLPPEPVPMDRWRHVYSAEVEWRREFGPKRAAERKLWLETIERVYPER